jgi:hypothetical protein
MMPSDVRLELPPDVAEEQAARQAFEQRALQMRISIALEIYTNYMGNNLLDYPVEDDNRADMLDIADQCLTAAAVFISAAQEEKV